MIISFFEGLRCRPSSLRFRFFEAFHFFRIDVSFSAGADARWCWLFSPRGFLLRRWLRQLSFPFVSLMKHWLLIDIATLMIPLWFHFSSISIFAATFFLRFFIFFFIFVAVFRFLSLISIDADFRLIYWYHFFSRLRYFIFRPPLWWLKIFFSLFLSPFSFLFLRKIFISWRRRPCREGVLMSWKYFDIFSKHFRWAISIISASSFLFSSTMIDDFHCHFHFVYWRLFCIDVLIFFAESNISTFLFTFSLFSFFDYFDFQPPLFLCWFSSFLHADVNIFSLYFLFHFSTLFSSIIFFSFSFRFSSMMPADIIFLHVFDDEISFRCCVMPAIFRWG